MKSLKAFAVPFFAIALIALVGFVVASALPAAAQGGVPPVTNIELRDGPSPGEVVVSWDAVPQATHYRIGYVNMEVDYFLATASCTGEWIEAFIYVDVNARNIPVNNGRAEYTVRRLSPGAAHAFTVLTSNDFDDSGRGGSVSSEFFWPSNPRWARLPGRDTLPPGMTMPTPDCSTAPQPPPSGSAAGDRAALIALYNATGGTNWTNNGNWLSARPIGEWHGVTTGATGRVTELRLKDNNLRGTLPAELGSLANLEALHLTNNLLTGQLPNTLDGMKRLRILYINNQEGLYQEGNDEDSGLTGPIPTSVGSMPSLEVMVLDRNKLTGPIPAELGNSKSLRRIAVNRNQITGAIPAELGNIPQLHTLGLANNDLSGTLPSELGNLKQLERLSLHDNEQLSGPVPASFGGLSKLYRLAISDTGMSGALPSNLTNLGAMNELFFDGTGLCAPTDDAFQQWLSGVKHRRGYNCQ